jgi:hypothetical protein
MKKLSVSQNPKSRQRGESPGHKFDLDLLLGSRLPQKCFQALELRWRLVPASTFKEIGLRLGVCAERARQLEQRAGRILRRIIQSGYRIHCLKDRPASSSIDELPLDGRARGALRRLRVNTIGELVALSPCQLLAVKNFGMTSLHRLRASLAVRGLDLMICSIHGQCCASCRETGGKLLWRFDPALGRMVRMQPWACPSRGRSR